MQYNDQVRFILIDLTEKDFNIFTRLAVVAVNYTTTVLGLPDM